MLICFLAGYDGNKLCRPIHSFLFRSLPKTCGIHANVLCSRENNLKYRLARRGERENGSRVRSSERAPRSLIHTSSPGNVYSRVDCAKIP
ncbi:hypothetical protein PUN28_004847 [Cardiocondyla obscurior]|uniref:Uncharacterized protein n=1 Tax=Cardiocondyla obscurior TaxID=286306 RepID=A0AAW2GEK7_9HYME